MIYQKVKRKVKKLQIIMEGMTGLHRNRFLILEQG